MSAGLVASVATALSTTGTANYGQSPTAGNMLLMSIVHVRASGTTPIHSVSAGWTLIDTVTAVNLTSSHRTSRYCRIATGGDTAPTITFGNTGACIIIIEEVSGLVATTTPDTVGTPATGNNSSVTVTMGSFTPSVAGTWVWSTAAQYATGTPTFTPTAPLVAFSAKAALNSANVATYQNFQRTAAAQTPEVAFSGGGGTPSASVLSAAWAQTNTGNFVSAFGANSNPGTTITFNTQGLQVGDFMIATMGNGNNNTGYTLAGWTAFNQTGGTQQSTVLYKFADATDVANQASTGFTFTNNVSAASRGVLEIWTGIDPTTPVLAIGLQRFGSQTSQVAASVSPASAGILTSTIVYATAATVITPPSGMAQNIQGGTPTRASAQVAVGSGATGTKTWTGTVAGISYVSMIVLNPASTASTATASISLSGSAAWTTSATATLSLTSSGTAAGDANATGSVVLTASAGAAAPGAATASLTLTSTAIASSTATGSITLTGSASPAAPAAATGSLTLTGSAAAQAPDTATGSLSLSATAAATANPSATGSLTLTGAATGAAPATASASLTLTAAATGQAPQTATAALTLTATATGSVPDTATGSITLAGNANAAAAAGASGSVTLTGTAGTTAPAEAIALLTLAATAAASATSEGAQGSLVLTASALTQALIGALATLELSGTAEAHPTAPVRDITVTAQMLAAAWTAVLAPETWSAALNNPTWTAHLEAT